MVLDAQGNLYGTTYSGGISYYDSCNYGCGVVFELTVGGTETVLHAFSVQQYDGAFPNGGLLLDSQGNLYGTTSGGGAHKWMGLLWLRHAVQDNAVAHLLTHDRVGSAVSADPLWL